MDGFEMISDSGLPPFKPRYVDGSEPTTTILGGLNIHLPSRVPSQGFDSQPYIYIYPSNVFKLLTFEMFRTSLMHLGVSIMFSHIWNMFAGWRVLVVYPCHGISKMFAKIPISPDEKTHSISCRAGRISKKILMMMEFKVL